MGKAATKPKRKFCNCMNKVDRELEKYNTTLSRMWVMVGPKFVEIPEITTRKLNGTIRGKPKTVVASHCPFCGTKLPESD